MNENTAVDLESEHKCCQKHGFSYGMRKSIAVDPEQAQKLELAMLPRLQKQNEGNDVFPEEAAVECNKLLAAPLFRKGDKLETISRNIFEGLVIFEILAQVDVEVECCCVKVIQGSPAEGSILGPEEWVRANHSEHKELPAEKFANVGQTLGLQVLKTKRPESATESCEAGADHKLEAGEAIKFRFCTRRFHDMCLLVSHTAWDSSRLHCRPQFGGPEFQLLADERLQGNDQRLLIPVISRKAGEVRSMRVKLSDFVDSEDLGTGLDSIEMAGKISAFFFGKHDFYNRHVDLDSYNPSYFRLQPLPVAVVLGTAFHVKALQHNSSTHGMRAQRDVSHFADMRQNLKGLSVSGVIHIELPKTLDGAGTLVECPPNPYTVLRGGPCVLLFPNDAHSQHEIHQRLLNHFRADHIWYEHVSSASSGSPGDTEGSGSCPILDGASVLLASERWLSLPKAILHRVCQPTHTLSEPMRVEPSGDSADFKDAADLDLTSTPLAAGSLSPQQISLHGSAPAACLPSFEPLDPSTHSSMWPPGITPLMSWHAWPPPWQPPAEEAWPIVLTSQRDWEPQMWGTRRKQRDHWSDQHIHSLLVKIADFQLVDDHRADATARAGTSQRCTSQKLTVKGRGVWRHVRHHCKGQCAEDLWRQEQDMVSSFWTCDQQYESPKLVRYANTAGKHELVQKMLAIGNFEMKNCLALQFIDRVRYLIKDEFGCLVLQQLLFEATGAVEYCQSMPFALDFVKNVVTALNKDLLAEKGIVDSSTDQHGNHVVQKWVQLLQKAPEEKGCLLQVLQDVGANATTIGVSQAGCRVIQRLLEVPNCNELAQQLLIEDTFAQLVTSEFGNYVIQHILSNNYFYAKDKLAVLEFICDNFALQAAGQFDDNDQDSLGQHCFYACDKYARHVVQKCLAMPEDTCEGWSKLRASLLEMVLEGDGNPKPQFLCLRGPDLHQQQVLEALKNYHPNGQQTRSALAVKHHTKHW